MRKIFSSFLSVYHHLNHLHHQQQHIRHQQQKHNNIATTTTGITENTIITSSITTVNQLFLCVGAG
jgi:hypothetical protein